MDILVKAIFEAVEQPGYSPEQKRLAVARAGLIAQAYGLEADLLFQDEHNGDADLGLASGSGSAATAH